MLRSAAAAAAISHCRAPMASAGDNITLNTSQPPRKREYRYAVYTIAAAAE